MSTNHAIALITSPFYPAVACAPQALPLPLLFSLFSLFSLIHHCDSRFVQSYRPVCYPHALLGVSQRGASRFVADHTPGHHSSLFCATFVSPQTP